MTEKEKLQNLDESMSSENLKKSLSSANLQTALSEKPAGSTEQPTQPTQPTEVVSSSLAEPKNDK